MELNPVDLKLIADIEGEGPWIEAAAGSISAALKEGDYLAALAQATVLANIGALIKVHAVPLAIRHNAATWSQVGAALQMTKQAAWEAHFEDLRRAMAADPAPDLTALGEPAAI
jgi:hypothetical protein